MLRALKSTLREEIHSNCTRTKAYQASNCVEIVILSFTIKEGKLRNLGMGDHLFQVEQASLVIAR